MEFNDNEFSVNFKAITEHSEFLSITKFTAAQLIETPYMSLGDFLKNISNTDLETLLNIIDETQEMEALNNEEPGPDFENVVMLALMLSSAEGLDTNSVEELHQNVNCLIALLTCEGLRRKNLVEIIYNNVSFGEDYKDKVIVKQTDKLKKMFEDDEDFE